MPRGTPDPENMPLRLRMATSRLEAWRREVSNPGYALRHVDSIDVVRQLEEEVAWLGTEVARRAEAGTGRTKERDG